ncbi:MAG: leucine--tRNA ligase, partial [Gemmatimonadota bacterium]
AGAYEPQAVERKWQRRWATERVNAADLDGARKPYFNLMMYPYPSAEGLHVGNVYAFTGADIHGRFQRLRGHDVFEPIGFDAFGIHSENFALQVGVHPMKLIPRNIRNFTRQLRRMGFMYDWDHTVDTTDPKYYKWTQWIFLQLYKAGLVYRAKAPVNWCPSCHTVLANEQVIAGRCERCGTEVVQRFLDQWFFRITRYVERLLANLDWIDWSDSTKRLQRNWIGKSEGAGIEFDVAREGAGPGARPDAASSDAPARCIPVFTTRPDTVFGATFLVLAPEHPLVPEVTTGDRREIVERYVANVTSLDLVERRKAVEAQERSGIPTGAYALNPATNERIPIWIADYVLMEYGTGAIMGVPAHDERDFDFAKRHGLEIREVVFPTEPNESPDQARRRWRAETGARPLDGAYAGEGVMVRSGRFDGTRTEEGRAAVTRWLEEKGRGRTAINYRLHDWCISRQRYWGPPIPMIHCERCGPVPVPETDLPVRLPYVRDFKPDESGVGPLARSKAFTKVKCPQCGAAARRETDVSDTFLDSAWYFLRYPSTDFDDVPFEKRRTKKWLPVETYIGGEEHAVLHLLYSRFTTMALHDIGHLEVEEPYERFRRHGLLIREGAKMSKSRGNVVVPDAYVERWGADTLRLYLMYLGPYEEGGDFRDSDIPGVHRFLNRVWDSVAQAIAEPDSSPLDPAIEHRLHATIRKVTEDTAALQYNTAVAAMMEYLNELRAGGRTARRAEVEPLVVLLAPYAPHIAEEMWTRLGHEGSLFVTARWPQYDPAKATADEVDFVVQVNGRVRATLHLPRGASEEAVRQAALAHDNVRRHLDGVQIRKAIFVKDRLLNLVVG